MPTYVSSPTTGNIQKHVYKAPHAILHIIDTAALFPGDELVPGIYFAVEVPEASKDTGGGVHTVGHLAATPPISIYESSDGGTTYHFAADVPSTVAVGMAKAPTEYWKSLISGLVPSVSFARPTNSFDCPDSGIASGWDTGSNLTVNLSHGPVLASATELEVLNGRNRAIIFKPPGSGIRASRLSGGEVIGFKTATLMDADKNEWKLTNLLRGRRGTEVEIPNLVADVHAEFIGVVGDGEDATRIASDDSPCPFLVVEKDSFVFHRLAPGDIGTTKIYKALSPGQELTDVGVGGLNYVSHTIAANNLLPFHPAHIAGSRDASNNLTVTWKRRTRYEVRLMGVKAHPYGEDRDAYEVDFYNAAGTAVLRTVEATTTTAAYSAANQTTDGLTPGDAVKCKVYQMSDIVGRGRTEMSTV